MWHRVHPRLPASSVAAPAQSASHNRPLSSSTADRRMTSSRPAKLLSLMESKSCAIILANYNGMNILCKTHRGWGGAAFASFSPLVTRHSPLSFLESHPYAMPKTNFHGITSLHKNQGVTPDVRTRHPAGGSGCCKNRRTSLRTLFQPCPNLVKAPDFESGERAFQARGRNAASHAGFQPWPQRG
jgi:hypothetical protein